MLTVVTNKLFSLYVRIRYWKVPATIRYFYRDTYSCMWAQAKYFIKDYIKKEKYKIITCYGEFGQELLFVLPFAYWHYKNGTLKATRGTKYTKELYFFSPDHKECFENRAIEGNYDYEMPRILYSHNYNMKKWEAVPFKKMYRNDVYVYDKPILIIANRYNMEWDGPPISFFSIPMLSQMIEALKDRFTIIYNRPLPKNITTDNSEIYDLKEHEWLRREYPDVLLLEDLYDENRANVRNFNHLQLMVYANSDHFISIHGGTATLASCFGGTNLILSKKGLEHHFGCFHTLFPKLSGATILHAKTDDEVMEYIQKYYLPRTLVIHETSQ
jgi:hypothetical protein